MVYDAPKRSLRFVELKTDAASRSVSQLQYYIRALETPWPELLSHISWIRQGSRHRDKYAHLQGQLADVSAFAERGAILLAPESARDGFSTALNAACAVEGTAWDAEESRWEFLSLSDFADSAIKTPYPEEWKALSAALRQV